MAFRAKDGKAFGNRQKQKAYDERQPEQAEREPAEEKAAEHEEPAGDGGVFEQEETGTDIHDHVAEHGPAEKVELHHDHEGGRHTKISHHGGKKHVSHHGSADEAHMHGAHAAGVEVPGAEQAAPQMAGGAPGGIPGM